MPNQDAKHTVLDPAAARVMRDAFQLAWSRLRDSGRVEGQPFKAEATRKAIALRILDQAQRGILDVDQLRDDALAYLLNEGGSFQVKVEQKPGRPHRNELGVH